MSDKTKIEWSDATWNPVTGCTKVSEGCRNCYALTFAERWRGTPGHYFENGFDITLRPDKLEQPLRWKRPRKIFVNSMSDLFHEDVPFEFIDQVFEVMAMSQRHTFQVLTKRPKRMLEWFDSVESRRPIPGHGVSTGQSPFCTGVDCKYHDSDVGYCGSPWPLPNVWLGVSVENQKAANERIPLLLQTPAAARFLSCEPLLGEVNLERWLPWDSHRKGMLGWERNPEYQGINWVIVGGESGHKARPMHPDWARSLRDQCEDAGVPFFFKQWGEHVVPSQMPKELYYAVENHGDGIGIGDTYRRVGKNKAGRLLDGCEWNEYPMVTPNE